MLQKLLRTFHKDPLVAISAFLCVGLLVVFILYPLGKAFELSLLKNGVFSLDAYVYAFKKAWLRKAIGNSLLLGAVSATSSVLLGYLFAFLLNRSVAPGKKFLRLMATLPVIAPPFMLTLAIILLLGKNGVITHQWLGLEEFDIYGLKGLLLVQTLSFFPIAYLTLDGVLQGLDATTEDAALDLGASRWRVFVDITLPLSAPGILSAWLLVFVTSLADFANPMILAGRFEVLSVQAYLQFTGMGNLPLGAALSNLLLVPSVAAYAFQKYYVSRKVVVTVTGKPQRGARDIIAPWARRGLVGITWCVSAVVILLYGTVLAGCFTRSWGIDYSLTLANFTYVYDIGRQAIFDTILLSAIATPIAGFLALVIAFLVVRKRFPGRKWLDVLAMLPFALPGTAVGIGYVLAFNREPLVLTGTAAIIVLCFVFRNMPVGIEAAKVSLAQIDRSLEEAAMNLGAGTATVFKDITLPLIRPACFAGMAYVFVHCMTAVSAVIFMVSARWNHMTVLILSQTEILRFSAASVLCLVLIVVVLSVFWALRKIIGVNPRAMGANT